MHKIYILSILRRQIIIIQPENLLYVCTTLERYYWMDFISGHDSVKTGIKALVDLHLPNAASAGVGVKDVRSAMSETFLVVSSLAIEQYRAEHVDDMDIKFILDKAYDDTLKAYESMPSSEEVMKDNSLTLSVASPMLADIINRLEGDVVNNKTCIALRYINHFAQSNNNKIMLSNWVVKKNLRERFATGLQNILKSDCLVGQTLRSVLREQCYLGSKGAASMQNFIGPLLSSHLSAEPLNITNVMDIPTFQPSVVTEEQTNLVVCVINDFIKELYSHPTITSYDSHILEKHELLDLRKSLEVVSKAIESASSRCFYADYANDEFEYAQCAIR